MTTANQDILNNYAHEQDKWDVSTSQCSRDRFADLTSSDFVDETGDQADGQVPQLWTAARQERAVNMIKQISGPNELVASDDFQARVLEDF